AATQLTPEGSARPIDRRHVPRHDRIQVIALAVHGRLPEAIVLGPLEDLEHVVAAAAEELLERELQRRRSRSANARADDEQTQACTSRKVAGCYPEPRAARRRRCDARPYHCRGDARQSAIGGVSAQRS